MYEHDQFRLLSRRGLPFDLEHEVRALVSPEHEVVTRGPWVMCRPATTNALPDQGWKIHVSATPDTAGLAMRRVGGEFGRDPFHFKCLRDREMVVAATSRWWPPGQVGKVITIYPHSTDACRDLLDRLYAALAGMEGPYVLTDRRFRDSRCLYYRYGGFGDTGRTKPDGTSAAVVYGPAGQEWADDRLPVYRRPHWVPDLFGEPEGAL